MVAAKLLDEAHQAHVIVEQLLPLGRILERHLQRTPVRDGDELHPDLVDLLLQIARLIEICREVVDKRFHIAEAGFMRFSEGEEHVLFPSTARVGGDANPVVWLRRRLRQAYGRRNRRQNIAPRDTHVISPYFPRSKRLRWFGCS